MVPVFQNQFLSVQLFWCNTQTVEYCRVCRVEPLWRNIEWYMGRYHDDRDKGALTLSHLYLLIGCSLPLWWLLAAVTPKFNNDDENTVTRCNQHWHLDFVQFAIGLCGLISVGVADAAAAVVGVTFGRKKSVQLC